MMIHKGLKILAIDLEFAQTYKKKLKKAAIMEIGMVFISNLGMPNEQEVKYSRMFNPKVCVSRYATKVTGITTEMIKPLKPIESYHKEIQEFFDNADILVFHGGAPDVQALENSGFTLCESKIVDTQMLAKYDTREYNGYSLKALSMEFELNSDGAHRALKDALMTLEIYKKLANKDHPLFEECNQKLINITV